MGGHRAWIYKELQRRCLVQEDDMMHDLVHSLACSVSRKFSCRIANGTSSCLHVGSARHLCFPSYKAPNELVFVPTRFWQKSIPYKYCSQNYSFPPAPEIFASVDDQLVRTGHVIREQSHSELAQHPKFHYSGGIPYCLVLFLRREYELYRNVESRLRSFLERCMVREEERASFMPPRLF